MTEQVAQWFQGLFSEGVGGEIIAFLASMLPIIIIAYRHGTGTGLMAGLVYGIIQQLLGLNTLSYVTTWQSILAVILLDYIVAFLVLGLGGISAAVLKSRPPRSRWAPPSYVCCAMPAT